MEEDSIMEEDYGGGLRAEADQFSTASTLINEELADTERGGR